MTHRSLSTPNSGLRVFSASLLSALMIMMPFVQLAAAEKRSEVRSQRPESGRQAAEGSRQDTAKSASAENVFLNAPVPKPAPEPPALLPVIVATKDDGLAAATTVAPGGTITYTVNINNTSPTDNATNVQFSDQIDGHTTLVPGSSVAAASDKYNAIGNVLLTIPDGATDLLGNDFDPDTGNNAGMTVTAETKSSTNCTGGCSNNVTINANGSFTYNPPVGFSGTDTFTYTAISGTSTATQTVTITVANEIWFINNNAGACPGAPCDGRLSHPFISLAAFTAANLGGAGQPGDNDWIFVYESALDYAGPATLRNGQKFIGQDATTSLAALTGFPAPSGTDPLPVMNSGNGTFVNITGANVNGINLLSGNTLRGLRVGNVGTGTKISGTSFGTLVVGNSGSPDVLLHGTGRALNLTTGTLSTSGGFISVTTTSSATQGISLSGVADSDGAGAGSFSFGPTTVSGSTTQGILIGTTPADLTFGTTSITGGTNGVSFQSNAGGTRTFGILGISGGANEAFLHGAGGGNVTVTGAATLSSTGSAISVSAPAATNAINFQAATSATSTGLGITAVNWAGAANTSMTFNSLSITRNNGTALNATGAGTINVTNATGSITNTTAGGPAIVAANIALNANFSSINSSAGANGVSLTSVTGTSNLGTGQLTGTVSGATFLVNSGTASVTYSGNITQAAAAPMVSIIDHATGTILFQTGTLLASLGTGISLDNADGTYNFTGTTNLAGGNAHIDIIDGSGGTISFGANTTITNPSGVAVNVDGSGVLNPVTGGITIAGSISKNTGGRLIDFNDYDTGTASISATLSCTTLCDGIEVTNDGTSSGIVNFTAATKTLNTAADNAVQLDNNDNGNVNFTGGGLDIDTTTGIGFNAINGGTVTVTGSGNSINSVSAAALTVTSTNIGAADLIFERIDSGNNTAAADPASGIILNSTGSAGGLNVTGTGTTDGSGGTIQSTSADAISLTTTSSVVLKNMIIGDNAAVHTEAVSATNNIGDDGIASTAVTPVAGDTYGLDIDNLKIARTAGGGIDGAGGGNVGLHVNNTEIINAGDAGTPSSTSSDEDAIGYGSGFAGNADQLTGTVLIENSTFAAFIDHGIQMENSGSGTLNMTVSNVTMKNNDGLTLCSGGPCEGSAIQVIADGSTIAGGTGPTINLTVRTLTVTNIDQDGIDAIADPGGNINVTVGDPSNNATNGMTFNCPNGDQVLRFNSGSPDSDDIATFNFNVRNVIVQNSPGTLVIFKAANQMTGKFINSTLDQNNATATTLASRGIEITADGDASGGANEVPSMTILIDNVTLNRIGGDGIQAFMTDVTNASSRLDLTIQNCNIGTNPANTAQTGLEIGLNNSLASEGIEIRNGVTTTNNGQLYAHISNNNIRNATSLSGSADGIDIDAEFLSTSHVTVVNNDIFAAPGTTDYDLAVEVNTAFMCADFTGNTDSNDANAGADITNNGDAADFQVEGGSASLAGSNPAISPFNFTGTFASGTCTMPNTPSGGFFALNQSNPQMYLASLTTAQVANKLPVAKFASAENARTIGTLPATATQPSLVNQVANNSLMAANAVPSNRDNKTDVRRSHHAQFNRSRSLKAVKADDGPLTPTAGEAVGPITIGTLEPGKSVTIKYSATVNTAPTARQASHQGSFSFTNGGTSPLVTDDTDSPGVPLNDPTVTLFNVLMTWNGSTDTDWNNPLNWTAPAGGTAYAPGVTNPAVNDVEIPSVGMQPTIGTTDIGIYSLLVSTAKVLTITNPRVLTIGGSPGGNLQLDGVISGGNLNLGTGTHTINVAGGSLSSTNVATVLSGSTVTLTSALQAGALAVNAGGSMNITNQTLSLNGSGAALTVPGGATFTTTGSTVVFNGTAAQQAAGIAYNNLTINNTIGTFVTGVTLTGNATINGALALTSSDLDTGAFTLTQPNTTASTGVSDVVGTIARTGGPFALATPLTFGNPNNIITFTAGASRPTTMTLTMAKTPPATYAIAVARNYTITPTGGAGYTATLRLHYRDAELNGNDETSIPNFNLRRGPSWNAVVPTARNTAGVDDNWLESNAVTQFSQWTFANLAPTASGGTITGRIVDDNGAPVEGAVVRLSGSQNRKFITNANGVYTFENVETGGFYNVTPSRVNYNFSPAVISFSQLGETTEAAFGATATGGSINPLDTPEYFVRQNYIDFLGREPDEAGFNFWSDQILSCGGDTDCVDRKRTNVSAAYFLSIEFQETGGLVDGLYRASFGRRPSYGEFKPDAAAVAPLLVVNSDGWQTVLENGKAAFIDAFVQRAAFRTAFDGMSNETYVATLIANTGAVFTSAERNALVSGLNTGMTRGAALRAIVENPNFVNAKRNNAFVMMEYFGYLRREPDAVGFDFWLGKLNQFNGNFEQAEMVRSFVVSSEYRNRFPK